MISLYHGTSEWSDATECDDLIPGFDGMIHFSPDQESASKYAPVVVECQGDFDLGSLPVLPDLGDFNPFKMAQELQKQGIITDAELARVDENSDREGNAKDFSPLSIIENYRDQYEPEYFAGMSLREMLEERVEDYDNNVSSARIAAAEEDLELLDRVEDARGDLFEILRSKGVVAFKYINDYDDAYTGDWSIAIIDTSAVSDPHVSVAPTRAHQPSIMPVKDAVDEYRTHMEPISGAASRRLEYAGGSGANTYAPRRGRGNLRR